MEGVVLQDIADMCLYDATLSHEGGVPQMSIWGSSHLGYCTHCFGCCSRLECSPVPTSPRLLQPRDEKVQGLGNHMVHK